MKKYWFTAACVFALVFAVLGGVRKLGGRPGPARSNGSEPARPSPIDEQLARPAAVIAGESVRTRVADTTAAAAVSTKAAKELPGRDWAVIAAIYKEFEPAERRARSISAASAFKATVFPRKGEGAKYMVVLDSALTQGKAAEIRDRAVAEGMPADTYVTRLISQP